MELGRCNASNHVCDGIPTQRVLQETRKLRVTIRDVRTAGACRKLRDDLAQTRKTSIDGNTLFGPLTLSTCILQSLTTSKIDKVKFAVDGNHMFSSGHCLQGDRESLVGCGRGLVLVLPLNEVQTEDGM